MVERFLPVPGYEGRYHVSDLGRVLSLLWSRPRLLSTPPNADGYLLVQLSAGGRGQSFYVHDLVWSTFRGSKNGRDIDHRDRNKANPRLRNLRLATKAGNQANQLRIAPRESRYRGVARSGNRWRAKIGYDYGTINLGTFDTQAEAGAAYDREAFRLFGKFAALNFPRRA